MRIYVYFVFQYCVNHRPPGWQHTDILTVKLAVWGDDSFEHVLKVRFRMSCFVCLYRCRVECLVVAEQHKPGPCSSSLLPSRQCHLSTRPSLVYALKCLSFSALRCANRHRCMYFSTLLWHCLHLVTHSFSPLDYMWELWNLTILFTDRFKHSFYSSQQKTLVSTLHF